MLTILNKSYTSNESLFYFALCWLSSYSLFTDKHLINHAQFFCPCSYYKIHNC